MCVCVCVCENRDVKTEGEPGGGDMRKVKVKPHRAAKADAQSARGGRPRASSIYHSGGRVRGGETRGIWDERIRQSDRGSTGGRRPERSARANGRKQAGGWGGGAGAEDKCRN